MAQIIENPVILADGSAYLYRAYYAFPQLTNSSGEPTGAIYGVLNMLKSLLVRYQSSYVTLVFDAGGRTFRDELFQHYKSHRQAMPEDLRSQITPLYDIIKAMGLPLLAVSGVEADDVIGTLALEAARKGRNVIISTSDKDMAQLVSSKINLIDTMSNTIFSPEKVRLKFGVPPELIIDYLSLIGDRSDNIPGVPGIGEKTARLLLQNLGGLDTVYQKLDNINNMNFHGAKTIAAKLEQYRDIAFLSYQLATIKTNVPLTLSYDQLTVEEPEIETLMFLFQRYEFKRWLNDLKSGKWIYKYKKVTVPTPSFTATHLTAIEKKTEALTKDRYVIINTIATLKVWVDTMRNAGVFAFDIETDKPDTLTANLIGVCFTIKPGEAAYLLIGHDDYLDVPTQLDRTKVLLALKSLFEDPTIGKIGHNIKFNIGVLQKHGINLDGILFDTMLESYVLNSIAGRHDIDSLAKRFLQNAAVSFKKITNKNRSDIILNQTTMEQDKLYFAKDAEITIRLHQKLWPRIKKTPKLKRVFEEIEMPLVPILSRIERIGVLIDKSILASHSVELTKRLKKLEKEAHQIAKEPFNLSSIKQLQEILYCKQKLPVLKKTPSGSPSTNEEALAELALDYKLPKLILEYRSLAKLKSTYIDRLPQMINQLSKRVHTSYHQAITATGRLSSSNPNLQNIPVRNGEGRRIRQAFIAPPDTLIMAADYSQIELRIVAHLSRDSRLINAFATGKDIHSATAAEVFDISLDKVSQDQRRIAKAINFGLIYGMSAFGLARQLSVPRLKAQKYINLYFERYPGVWEYMENTRRHAINYGYVETMDGRRLYLPDIYSRNIMRKKSAERAAINAPMQGTAADIIKRAMIAIDNWLQQEALPVRIIMQVHDELVFEVKRDVVEIAKDQIKTLMESCFKMDIPLQVDVGIGENWDQAH